MNLSLVVDSVLSLPKAIKDTLKLEGEGIYILFNDSLNSDGWDFWVKEGTQVVEDGHFDAYRDQPVSSIKALHNKYPNLTFYIFNIGYYSYPNAWRTYKSEYISSVLNKLGVTYDLVDVSDALSDIEHSNIRSEINKLSSELAQAIRTHRKHIEHKDDANPYPYFGSTYDECDGQYNVRDFNPDEINSILSKEEDDISKLRRRLSELQNQISDGKVSVTVTGTEIGKTKDGDKLIKTDQSQDGDSEVVAIDSQGKITDPISDATNPRVRESVEFVFDADRLFELLDECSCDVNIPSGIDTSDFCDELVSYVGFLCDRFDLELGKLNIAVEGNVAKLYIK